MAQTRDAAAQSQPMGMGPAALAALLQSEIAAGRYPIGAVIPSEADLRAQFAVGRHTVREAVRRLVEAGLLERRQGAGTRVIAQRPRAAYTHSIATLSEIFEYTKDAQLEIAERAMVALDDADAALLAAVPRSSWLRLLGVRREVGQNAILSHTTVFFHARFAAIISKVNKPKGPLYMVIEAHTGELVQEARQEIATGPLPAAAARALDLPLGSPGIMVTRQYLDVSGGVMMASRNWHNFDFFRYAISLKRENV